MDEMIGNSLVAIYAIRERNASKKAIYKEQKVQ
jgi:hypothetical protein